jgi:hypothetical protein
LKFRVRWLAAVCAGWAVLTFAAQPPRRAAAKLQADASRQAVPAAASAPVIQQAITPAAMPGPQRIQIPDGEQLTYTATWRLWKVGTATITLDTRNVMRHIHFSANSMGVANVLYPVHDRIESTYDPLFFCATEVRKDTVEGRRKRRTRILYNPNRRQLVLDEDNLNDSPPMAKHEVKPISGCVLDLFSALYYVRSLPLQVGEVYNFPVNEGGKTAEIQLTADLKESVVTPAGTFQAIRTEPTVFNNKVFHRNGRMWVWFSNDNRHLPVMVKAKVSWGTITAVLTSIGKAAPNQPQPPVPLPSDVRAVP